MLYQLKILLRTLKRNPFILFVNITGLTISLTAFILLMVYINYESSFDSHIANKDRIVRLASEFNEGNSSSGLAKSLRYAHTEIPKQVGEIESSAQLFDGYTEKLIANENDYGSHRLIFADPEFFEVFGFELISGNKNEALRHNNSVVISDKTAIKVFGDTDCLNSVITIGNTDYTITGVIKELPENTHLKFDLLASMHNNEYNSAEYFTYYLLKKNINREKAENDIITLYDTEINRRFKSFNVTATSVLENLTDLHLHTISLATLSKKGNIFHIYIISVLAAFILLIAVVNFVNLYILHGEKRIKEIGTRKTLGASISSLKRIFYSEIALIVTIAFIAAIIFTIVLMPYFAELMQSNVNILDIVSIKNILTVILFLTALIFISGSYPAEYLSKLKIADVIKGGKKTITRRKWLTITSVTIQFSISAFLIISLLIVKSQVNYIKDIPLGFETENVIGINGFDSKISEHSKEIINELKSLSFIKNAGSSSSFMGGGWSGQAMWVYGQSSNSGKSVNNYRIGSGFGEVMNLKLTAGQFFNENDIYSIILNKAAIKELGLDQQAIGKKIILGDKTLELKGIVEDFYYDNPDVTIKPMALTYTDDTRVFYLKTISNLNSDKKAEIASIFNKYDSDYKYSSFGLSEKYNQRFLNEDRVMNLLTIGTLLAIFISFIGMVALSIYNVEKRTKEIGVRKVVGSSIQEILVMLLSDTLIWVAWAMIPAFIISYFLMNNWLESFPDRINIHVGYFVFAAITTLFIASVSVLIKSYDAARKNPVEALRYE